MTTKEAKALYESIMKKLAVDVKRQINEMSPGVYRKAAYARRQEGNMEAAKRLEAHAVTMDKMLRNAIDNDDRAYIIKQYPGVFFIKDNQICCNVTVEDENGNKKAFSLTAGSVKNLLKKLLVLINTSLADMKFFRIKISQPAKLLLTRMSHDMTDDEFDKLDEVLFDLYETVFVDSNTVDEFTDKVIRFDFGF